MHNITFQQKITDNEVVVLAMVICAVSVFGIIYTRLIIGIGNRRENGNNPHFACP